MPIDLYKLLGYDYRDKKRETQLSVDADVERAKRIAAEDWEAKKSQAKELEGIARNRFTENYAKTRLAEGQTEGVGEEAETAWAKKVASGDLKDVMDFEKTAGGLPGARKLSGTQVEASQEEAEANVAKGKANKLRGLAAVASLVAPGAGEALQKVFGEGLQAEAAGAEAARNEAETKRDVSAILKPDAAKVAEEQRQLTLSGERLANQARQNAVDTGRLELFEYPGRMDLQRRMGQAQLRGLEQQNEINDVLGEDLRRAEIERLEATAAAARSRAQGANKYGNMPGMSGQPIVPKKDPKDWNADDLDLSGGGIKVY